MSANDAARRCVMKRFEVTMSVMLVSCSAKATPTNATARPRSAHHASSDEPCGEL
jgi:hypothetical protein